jgi:hypothetical protein
VHVAKRVLFGSTLGAATAAALLNWVASYCLSSLISGVKSILRAHIMQKLNPISSPIGAISIRKRTIDTYM